MVRTPCCDKTGLRKGTWTPEEDRKLMAYVTRYGCWNWRQLPKFAAAAKDGKDNSSQDPKLRRGTSREKEETKLNDVDHLLIKAYEAESSNFWTEPFLSDINYMWSDVSSVVPYEADQFPLLDGEILYPFDFYDQLQGLDL
ncbi:hypothetical protein GOBAR_DD36748 [Gossypium barbadense]|nr:hypothetical protein GOBAR_DD36748 [Gossypium barbadense]